MLLEGKVAIVTGASRGIGRAIALDLAKNGAQVIINYNSNAQAAAEVVAEIEAGGGQALAVQANVSDFDAAQTLAKAARDQFGRIDILVNNAGITRDTLLLMMKEAQWDDVLDINLKSVFNCTKAVLRPMMRKKQGGRIINITSISGLSGLPGQTNYSASKAGMIGFTKALAKEVGSRKVTVNAVAPGFITTDLTADVPPETTEWVMKNAPLQRLGVAQEVANVVTFLASPLASYITGEVIRVDGGLAM